MPGGRESPSPERLTDAQKNAPADGQGTDNTDNKQKNLKSELDNLQSNPKGPMDDAVKDKFTKGEGKQTNT